MRAEEECFRKVAKGPWVWTKVIVVVKEALVVTVLAMIMEELHDSCFDIDLAIEVVIGVDAVSLVGSGAEMTGRGAAYDLLGLGTTKA